MSAPVDLTGRRFGRLVGVAFTGRRRGNHRLWTFRCDCGAGHIASTNDVRNGGTKSCGCSRSGVNATHGDKKSREYGIWAGMIQRCTNPRRRSYPAYGGRGIVVCERWRTYENFLADMGRAPARHTIDRIDNDGNYEPGNCQWATWKQQARNKQNTRLVKMGEHAVSAAEAAETLGVPVNTIYARIQRGRDPLTPSDTAKRKITALGETHGIAEWSRITGISDDTMSHRLAMGWSEHDTVTRPLRVTRMVSR